MYAVTLTYLRTGRTVLLGFANSTDEVDILAAPYLNGNFIVRVELAI